jgi:iron complex outermembrane receptor protein
MGFGKEIHEQVLSSKILSSRLVILGFVGWLVLLQAPGPAGAQSTAQAASPPAHLAGADATTPGQPTATPEIGGSPDSTLEEVVVTARRRSENLERVPVAVSALGPAQLAEREVREQSDLQTAVPGLTVVETENNNQLNYSLRGQSIDAFSGSRPAVLTYVDDVQVTNQSAGSLYDLDSVQVLKGPQRTLFGRNVTGGAILFNTAKPTNQTDGFLTASVGNYGFQEIQGAVNVPLVDDKVLLRLAGDIDDRNGFQRNLFNGDEYGAQHRHSLRATLTFRPADQLENTSVIEYDSSAGNNVSPEGYSAYACGSSHNGVPLATQAGCFYSPGLDQVLGIPGAWNAYLAAHPQAPSGGLVAFINQQRAMGPWVIDTDDPNSHYGHNFYAANTTTYDLTDTLRLKNIAGYANSYSKDEQDNDGTPYGIQEQSNGRGSVGNIASTDQGSDEFQILGKALNDKLSYVAGVYYAIEVDENLNPLDVFDLTPVLPPPTPQNTDYRTSSHTEAGYAQGTYDLSQLTGVNGLSFTGGYRYSWEQEHINPLPMSLYSAYQPESKSFSDPSWQVGMEYQVNANLLLYVESRDSWRSGGFNGAAPPVLAVAAGGGNLFLPETTHDVEVGEKFQGDILGKPTTLNVALFNQWIDNVQRAVYLSINGIISAVTANVPHAVVRGIEVDGRTSLTRWLDIGGNAAATDAEYTSPTIDLFSQGFTFGPYGDTPKRSGSVFARVRLPVADGIGTMYLRGEVYAQTGVYFTNLGGTSNPGALLPGYHLLNFRYEWENLGRQNITLGAFVKNATNTPYYVGGTATGAAFGLNNAIPGEPRTFGIELGYRF